MTDYSRMRRDQLRALVARIQLRDPSGLEWRSLLQGAGGSITRADGIRIFVVAHAHGWTGNVFGGGERYRFEVPAFRDGEAEAVVDRFLAENLPPILALQSRRELAERRARLAETFRAHGLDLLGGANGWTGLSLTDADVRAILHARGIPVPDELTEGATP